MREHVPSKQNEKDIPVTTIWQKRSRLHRQRAWQRLGLALAFLLMLASSPWATASPMSASLVTITPAAIPLYRVGCTIPICA
jgi:hypothetical protein